MGEGLNNVKQDLFEEPGGNTVQQPNESAADVEQHRFRCEVRDVLRIAHRKGADASDRYLLRVEEKRGTESAERLRATAKDQWIKGNRGEAGQWK